MIMFRARFNLQYNPVLMQKQFSCMICTEQYCQANPPRLIPQCGHSLCEKCILQQIKKKGKEYILLCPQDNESTHLKQATTAMFPKNVALLRLLTHKKDPQPQSSNSLDQSNIVSKVPAPDEEQEKELIQGIKESTRSTDKIAGSQQSINLNLDNFCLIHERELEIICIKDKTKICSTCAIFGQHKGHDFKSIEEVEKDKMRACDQILKVIEKKEQLQQKIAGTETKVENSKQLRDKKQQLTKSIKEHFQKLVDILALSQKKALDKLSRRFQALEAENNSLVLPERTTRDYMEWESQALKSINAFESTNLVEQLELLNYEKKEDNVDVVAIGINMLKQYQEKCEEILQKMNQNVKDSVTVQYKSGIDLGIAGYCSVTSRESNQYTKKESIESQITINVKKSQTYPTQKSLSYESKAVPGQSEKLQQIDSQRGHTEEKRKPSDHNDDLLLEEFKQEEDFISSSTSLINIPTITPLQINSLDNSLEQTPINSEDRRIELSPIHKNQKTSQSFNSSFIKGGVDTSFQGKKTSRLPVAAIKKKLKIKLPEKYEKVLDGILTDSIEVADFTNGELGDQVLVQITEHLKGKKVKTLKLIRNKLTDQGMEKIWGSLGNIITLNLSQNFLTDRFVDRLLQNIPKLPHLRNVILCQNKIKERNVKLRVQEIKKHQILVSI